MGKKKRQKYRADAAAETQPNAPAQAEPRSPAAKETAAERALEIYGGAMVIAAAFAGVVIFAAINGFLLCEDAMITLRYSRNLAEGHGLVYNPGEFFESNTDFLWSVLLSGGFLLGADPVSYLRFTGLAIAAALVAVTYTAARQIGTRRDATFAAVLLGFHASLGSFVVSGFAPHLPPLFVLAAGVFAFKTAQTARAIFAAACGLCLFGAMLSRLDAAVIVAPMGLYALWAAWQNKAARIRNIALIGVLPGALFAAYLAFKHSVYGDIFPATYYAKADLPQNIVEWYDAPGRGKSYIWLYAREYWLVFMAPFILWGARKMAVAGVRGAPDWGRIIGNWGERQLLLLACAAAVALWCAYMLRVGGGYYEFRFMVAVAPFIFILIARALGGLQFPSAVAVAAALLLASFVHGASYDRDPAKHRDGIAYYLNPEWCYAQDRIDKEEKEWGAFGRFLTFDHNGAPYKVKVASPPSGYVPFYAGFYSLDSRGWNDTRVMKPGNHFLLYDPLPGHQRVVAPQYVSEWGADLFMGDLYIVEADDDVIGNLGALEIIFGRRPNPYLGMAWYWEPEVLKQIPPDAKIVELPLPLSGRKILAVYWTRSEAMDAFFARKNITLHDIPARRG